MGGTSLGGTMKELLQDYENLYFDRVTGGYLIQSKVKPMANIYITDEQLKELDIDLFNSVMVILNRKE